MSSTKRLRGWRPKQCLFMFAALQNPYITQPNGNMRADTLIMLHAVHLFSPGSINIPMASVMNTKSGDAIHQHRASRELAGLTQQDRIALLEQQKIGLVRLAAYTDIGPNRANLHPPEAETAGAARCRGCRIAGAIIVA